MFNYFSFGYIPIGSFFKDLLGRFSGVQNLTKRLQAKTVMTCLDPVKGQKILDFGCGGGFFTYEIARRGAHATGLDVCRLPYPDMAVNDGTMDFAVISPGERVPFPDEYFDKVLMSEVFVVLAEPEHVLRELNRVLKVGGTLIVVNTLGRLNIKEAYERKSMLVKVLRRLFMNCPKDYDDFVRRFLEIDGVKKMRWYSALEMKTHLENCGFKNIIVQYPFKAAAFNLIAWAQYFSVSRHGILHIQFGVLRYLALEILNALVRQKDASNLVIIGGK